MYVLGNGNVSVAYAVCRIFWSEPTTVSLYVSIL